jgi:Domain of unknown function (DUF4124)
MKMFVLVLILCGTTPAWCEIYTWKDKGGTAHFTNSMYDIPDRYRSRAKVLDLGIEPKADTPSQQEVRQPPAMSQLPALPTTTLRPGSLREKKPSRRAGKKPSEQ